MRPRRPEARPASGRRAGVVAAALFVAVAFGASAGPAGADPAPFDALLAPDTVRVDVGDTTTVVFRVAESAQQFNAYDLSVSFDPTRVDLVSVEQGALMTGACGNTFAYLDSTASVLTYSHSLLCAGIALDGPGELCRVGFRGVADGVVRLEILTDPDFAFYDAGIYVNPLHPTFPREVTLGTAVIVVGDVPVGGPAIGSGGPAGGAGVDLRFFPNPARGDGAFRLELPASGAWRLDVFDAGGRRVATRRGAVGSAGARIVPWGRADDLGAPRPAGVYFARLTTAAGRADARVVLVR